MNRALALSVRERITHACFSRAPARGAYADLGPRLAEAVVRTCDTRTPGESPPVQPIATGSTLRPAPVVARTPALATSTAATARPRSRRRSQTLAFRETKRIRVVMRRRKPARTRMRQGAYGIRTRAAAVRGRCPRPLDECAGRDSV